MLKLPQRETVNVQKRVWEEDWPLWGGRIPGQMTMNKEPSSKASDTVDHHVCLCIEVETGI